MPQGPGEDLLLTIFADVHYFFGSQHDKPPHHRFDKGSYVYLYRNMIQSRGRLEVANNAGTPAQDAFSGYIDSTYTQYSHKHTNLVTMTVDGASLAYGAPPCLPNDLRQWYLPAYDPRNEAKYMFRLQTIDFYFWKVEDALLFLHSVGGLLPPAQLRILDPPTTPITHIDHVSPIIEKLETAAISDPSYHYNQRESGNISVISTHPPVPSNSTAPYFSRATSVTANATNKPEELPGDYAPLAYNPAAPAAPEAIAHREKTPPPVEAASGTGLAAVVYEAASPTCTPAPLFQKPMPALPPSAFNPTMSNTHPALHQSPPQSQSSYPIANVDPSRHGLLSHSRHSPQSTPGPGSHHSSRVVSAAPSRNDSFAPPPTLSRLPSDTHPSPLYPSPPQPQHVSPNPFTFTPSPTPPTSTHLSSSTLVGVPVAVPGAGYSNYQYTATSPAVASPPGQYMDYSVHQTHYRPTEQEVMGRKVADAKPTGGDKRLGKMDKKVGGFLKRLEKKIG